MPFEKCLHALIFPSETAALPLPQRRRLESNSEIFTYTPLKKSHMKTVEKKICKAGVGTGSTLPLGKPKRSAARFQHW